MDAIGIAGNLFWCEQHMFVCSIFIMTEFLDLRHHVINITECSSLLPNNILPHRKHQCNCIFFWTLINCVGCGNHFTEICSFICMTSNFGNSSWTLREKCESSISEIFLSTAHLWCAFVKYIWIEYGVCVFFCQWFWM